MKCTSSIERAVLAAFLLCCLGAINACGNKGPLYLPEPPVQQQLPEREDNPPKESAPEKSAPEEQTPQEPAPE
ncbi:MAG: hypothetical protein DRR06_03690 [Gammaproteobacteria bacterium]|nr:MAG: hypothetical protein DRR06_03690 [Gammaproteobacteria bacterium]RLA54099.1 MAG: hypothetical protein DRR42_02875 [Gammaproteobacteria bacterium]